MAMIPDQDREFLRVRFLEELVDPVMLTLFTKQPGAMEEPGLECEFCRETEQLLVELSELSTKINIDIREYSPDDEMVKELGIDKLPAIILSSGDVRGVRYYGIPGGFEFSSLVADISDLSRNQTSLSQEVKDKIRSIDEDIHIQVFVTPTCPYCPSVVRMAHQMAIEHPERITADAIEASEFPYLVDKYGIGAVPTVVINEDVRFEGALPDGDFADRVVRAAA